MSEQNSTPGQSEAAVESAPSAEADSAVPAEAAAPADSTMPAEGAAPADSTALAEAAAPAEATAPAEPAAPAESAAPAADQPSPSGQASAADLAGLVGDKSDDALVSMINEIGADTFLGGIFDEMGKRFLPEKAAGRTAVIEYDINLPGSTEIYQLDVAGGTCSVSKGAAKEASVALTLAAPDFLRLITGKLNGVNAFMSGKLKLKGDMMLAQTMQGWFDPS